MIYPRCASHRHTWLTWESASASSFWLMPHRLATFCWQSLWTFMAQSEDRELKTRSDKRNNSNWCCYALRRHPNIKQTWKASRSTALPPKRRMPWRYPLKPCARTLACFKTDQKRRPKQKVNVNFSFSFALCCVVFVFVDDIIALIFLSGMLMDWIHRTTMSPGFPLFISFWP